MFRSDPQGTLDRLHPQRLTSLIFVPCLLVILVLAAGCGRDPVGAGVAGQGSSTAPSTSPSGASRDAQLAYARCMRDHGISDFPDPQPGGGFALQGGPGSDLDPNNTSFKAADDACKPLLPAPPTGQEAESRAAALRFARCMRAHGFPDFPDPNAEGGVDIDAGANPELDPN